MDKEYKKHMKEELSFYDMSFKARILRYDSYYIGCYLKRLRCIEWYESQSKNFVNIFLRG